MSKQVHQEIIDLADKPEELVIELTNLGHGDLNSIAMHLKLPFGNNPDLETKRARIYNGVRQKYGTK